MVKLNPNDLEKNQYAAFVSFLNYSDGTIRDDDGAYYDFLDLRKVSQESLLKICKICKSHFPEAPFVVYRSAKQLKKEYGQFYLTTDGCNIVHDCPPDMLPPITIIDEPQIDKTVPEVKSSNPEWTREDVIKLLTQEAHMVGRMLGSGYDWLEQIHSKWAYTWIVNPDNFKIMVHQAHRDSYKSSTLRLTLAIIMILFPLKKIVLIRKSEDGASELIDGVKKILKTPLFNTFVGILYPDILKSGGLKFTQSSGLVCDTNLNVSLSGEAQLRGCGLSSPITGMHGELIVTDDICTLDDRLSASERARTIARYKELMNVLSNNKNAANVTVLNIGTPWHEEDVFQQMELGLKPKSDEQIQLENDFDKNEEKIRLLDMERGKFKYNCYQTGLMTEKDIEWKRKVLNDEMLFNANYLLRLLQDEEKPFPKIDNVGHYSNSFFADAYEMIATIDAKYSGVDTCSVSVGAYDYEKDCAVVYGKIYTVSLEQNYLDVAQLLWDFGVQKIYMETNTDKGLMGTKFRELGFDCEGYHESTNKHIKIISSIKPFWRPIGASMLPSVQFTQETDPDYLSQIHNYTKGVKKDDAPDNLACLLLKAKWGTLPIRITMT